MRAEWPPLWGVTCLETEPCPDPCTYDDSCPTDCRREARHGLQQLQSLWIIPAAAATAVPMDNPYCSCELTRVRSGEWSAWGNCSRGCGGGVRRRQYTVLAAARNAGALSSVLASGGVSHFNSIAPMPLGFYRRQRVHLRLVRRRDRAGGAAAAALQLHTPCGESLLHTTTPHHTHTHTLRHTHAHTQHTHTII